MNYESVAPKIPRRCKALRDSKVHSKMTNDSKITPKD